MVPTRMACQNLTPENIKGRQYMIQYGANKNGRSTGENARATIMFLVRLVNSENGPAVSLQEQSKITPLRAPRPLSLKCTRWHLVLYHRIFYHSTATICVPEVKTFSVAHTHSTHTLEGGGCSDLLFLGSYSTACLCCCRSTRYIQCATAPERPD